MRGKPFALPGFNRPLDMPGGGVARAFFLGWLVAFSPLIASVAYSAPGVPNAGQILETIPPLPVAPATLPAMPQREDVARPAMAGGEKIRIPLRSVRISGATIYPVATLDALLRDVRHEKPV